MVSGVPGIGKTTAVRVVGEEMGFEILEFNASDTRSRKKLESHMVDTIDNHSMTEYFVKQKQVKKTLVVMDEVDGMSSGDRGGMTQLIKLIKISKVPIICICNDRSSQKVRSLANYCLDLRFRRPTAQQTVARLNAIAQREGLNLDHQALSQLANGVHGDVRQMLHLLQFWSNDNNNNGRLTYDDVKSQMNNAKKDVTMGPWDVMPRFFSPGLKCNDALDYFFVDHQLMPLFLHENYLHLQTGRHLAEEKLSLMSKACDSVADGDLIDHEIRSKQYYPLLTSYGLLSTMRPAMYIQEAKMGRPSGGYQFPSWLGKFSKRRKNERLFSELANHMHHHAIGGISGGSNGIALDYLPILKDEMFTPMEKYNEKGIGSVVNFMKEYGLSREDWNSISELGIYTCKENPKLLKEHPELNRQVKVATKVKSTFTRQCNQELANYAKANAGSSGKGTKAPKLNVNQEGDPVDSNNQQSQNDSEEDNDGDNEQDSLKNDGLIKIKKGRTKGKSTSTSKKGGNAKTTKRKAKGKAQTKSKGKSKATAHKTKSKRK